MEYYSNIKQKATPVEGVDLTNKKYVDDAIQANAIGKETVLYEGSISSAGTYTLADNVNNYDFIIINHRQASGVNCQSTTLTKYEISKCSDYEHKFMCVLGYGSSEDFTSGYFNNDKLILSSYNNQNITSITGYKFGQITVQNTITNPSPGESYSTDEQLTGGTWINGKPIYRKVLVFASSITITTDAWTSIGVTIPDIDIIISSYHYEKNVYRYGGNAIFVKNTSPLQCSSSSNISFNYLILEYTKTTD